MGGNLSTIPPQNPNSTNSSATETASATMASSNSPPTHELNLQSEPTHDPKPQEKGEKSSDPLLENQPPEDLEVKQDGLVEGEGEEEEEGECGFCLFMKAGACKDVFIEWEQCVEEGDQNKEDIVEKCFEVTSNLKKCMEAHPDHYGPLLKVEKDAQEKIMKDLEKEKEIAEGVAEESSALGVSEGKSEEKDGVLEVLEQKIEEKDGVLEVPEQKIEEKDGVLNASEEKKEGSS